MGVKITFLNGYLYAEVYVTQLKGFENLTRPDYVFKLKKALYGLKQVPRDWYERLTKFLVIKGYFRWGVDQTLFIKRLNSDLIVA